MFDDSSHQIIQQWSLNFTLRFWVKHHLMMGMQLVITNTTQESNEWIPSPSNAIPLQQSQLDCKNK